MYTYILINIKANTHQTILINKEQLKDSNERSSLMYCFFIEYVFVFIQL